jgi:catechol 2,3-dioxygenase-like lactoylglutathione lyase family enzyme
MFDHVTIRVSDRQASERFYATVLATLGRGDNAGDEDYTEWEDFSLGAASEEKPVTRGLHIGFVAPSHAEVDEFWRVGTAAGYRSDGEPGPRPEYGDDYYGSFLLDPDGNSAEAVWHDSLRRGGVVDHLWIRVADVARSKAFYEEVAANSDLRLKTDTPERAQFTNGNGSFSLVAGDRPTQNLHMAFPAPDNAAVEAFHAALTAAGYTDNGAPGERPVYHAGYYGAFVLDPDGNNIELVNHNRG